MTRPTLCSLSRTVFVATLGVLACIWASGSIAFAQRGGGQFGGVGHFSAPHIPAPHIFPYRPIYPVRPIYPLPFRPIYPLRPISPIFVSPGFGFFGWPYFGLGWEFSSIWRQNCGPYWGWGYFCNPYPVYFYGGEERALAQLYLKDGTVYNVTDYWLVDNQLHFMTVEEGGAKLAEHTIDFNQLDLQKTIEADTQRGFRFVLRNEPIQQYLRDHPEIGAPGAPAPLAPPPSSQQPQ